MVDLQDEMCKSCPFSMINTHRCLDTSTHFAWLVNKGHFRIELHTFTVTYISPPAPPPSNLISRN